ncbi:TlpA family protein disulfide reductase [Cytobacillus sp. FJAT-54145]|uniref:TlpA family protein disulfide reductase n=1 Tax=Cytobacillus spartinae TaxID=3299023 RepID=A0ABW6KI98_9BACI
MLLETIPNFKFEDIEGNEVSLKDFVGKKTLIFMWASW